MTAGMRRRLRLKFSFAIWGGRAYQGAQRTSTPRFRLGPTEGESETAADTSGRRGLRWDGGELVLKHAFQERKPGVDQQWRCGTRNS